MNARTILSIAGLLALAGCVTTTVSSDRPAVPAVEGPSSVEHAVASDPCASHLHDISGAMLMYYAINRELPAKLEDLKPLADLDQALDFTCPLSHQPYVYVPGGLETAGRSKIIILHDAAPSHAGKRWCILMEPAKGKSAPSMEVLLVPEPIFLGYQPVIPR